MCVSGGLSQVLSHIGNDGGLWWMAVALLDLVNHPLTFELVNRVFISVKSNHFNEQLCSTMRETNNIIKYGST